MFKFIKDKVPKNSFIYHVLTLTSGTIIAQLISVAISPIITRLYLPSDMGVLASIMAVSTIVSTIANGRYDLAIVLPKKENEANALAVLGFIITCLFSLLFFLLLLVFNTFFRKIFGLKNISNYLYYSISLLIFFSGMITLLTRIAMRDKSYALLARTGVTNTIVGSITKISFGSLNAGIFGLFTSTIIGNILQTVLLLNGSKKRLRDTEDRPNFKIIKQVAVRYKDFPLVSSWSALLNTASTQVPMILFASLFSPTVAGFYSLSNRVLQLPMALIGSSISSVFYEKSASYRDDEKELSRITLEIFKKLILIGALSMSVVMVYGDILFSFVFGIKWLQSGQYAQWLSVWLCFVLASSPLSILYFTLEKQKEGFWVNLIMFSSRILTLFIGYWLNLDDLVLIAIFSIVGTVLWIAMSVRVLIIAKVSVKDVLVQVFGVPISIFSLQYILGIFLKGLFL